MSFFGHFPYQLGIPSCVVDHLSKQTLPANQLVRTAGFDDPAFIHHNDFVIVGDGVQPMCDSDDSCFFEPVVNAVLDEMVGLHIHVRCRLI